MSIPIFSLKRFELCTENIHYKHCKVYEQLNFWKYLNKIWNINIAFSTCIQCVLNVFTIIIVYLKSVYMKIIMKDPHLSKYI